MLYFFLFLFVLRHKILYFIVLAAAASPLYTPVKTIARKGVKNLLRTDYY